MKRKDKIKAATNATPSYSAEHIAYLNAITRKKRFITIMQWAILFLFIGIWELGAQTGIIDPFITSSPSRVIATIANLYEEGTLFLHIWTTLIETILGFILGTILGTAIAILLWWNDTFCRIMDPYLVILNALPKIALGPILIVWIGSGMDSIVVMALLVSLVVTIMTVLAGFMEEKTHRQLLMQTLGASKWQTFTMVILPASVPTIVSALKLSVGMSWVGVIVGEYLVSKAGLGYLIVYGGQVFKLDLVMASIVILCILAALMYYAVTAMEQLLIRWRSHNG